MRNKSTHLLMILILLFNILSACKSEEKPSPNIIFFLVDDMGWQDTSVPFWSEKTHFNERYHTPNMERLASQGMIFTQAYAYTVCSPSRTSIMTGMNAARHSVTNWTLHFNTSTDSKDSILQMPKWNVNGLQPVDTIENSVHATTLPQLLQEKGYFTIHAGKAHWGASGTPGANPLNLGFDINIAGHHAGAPASYQGENNFSNPNGDGTWDVPGLEKYHGQAINLTDALTLESIDAMDQALSNNKPFYLYMAHYTVHVPLEPHHPYYKKYKELGLDEREARYASMVEGMDHSLGQLMDYLDKKGIADNTIILFMSDNGGLSAHARGGEPNTHNWPLKSGKGSAYEGGIRVPMLVSWPKTVKPGSKSIEPLLIEDFFPSILEMAGFQEYHTIQKIDGVSFLPALKSENQTNSSDRSLIWHYPNKWGGIGPGIGTTSTIRKGDWKLIYWYKDQKIELYNLAEDIQEKNNLADQNPEIAQELALELGSYLRSVNAQRPSFIETGKPVPWPDEI